MLRWRRHIPLRRRGCRRQRWRSLALHRRHLRAIHTLPPTRYFVCRALLRLVWLFSLRRWYRRRTDRYRAGNRRRLATAAAWSRIVVRIIVRILTRRRRWHGWRCAARDVHTLSALQLRCRRWWRRDSSRSSISVLRNRRWSCGFISGRAVVKTRLPRMTAGLQRFLMRSTTRNVGIVVAFIVTLALLITRQCRRHRRSCASRRWRRSSRWWRWRWSRTPDRAPRYRRWHPTHALL